jgi:hypothetical protein
MAGIVGLGTTYNLPNFVGELFTISPEDTPLTSAIGGLTGGKRANAKIFEWQFYDLRSPSVRARLEGAAAPTAENRVRGHAFNVVQIIHEAVDVSYTKLASLGQLGLPDAETPALEQVNALGVQPVQDEEAFQLSAALRQIARDVEHAFINSTFNLPVDNTTARKTRGLIEAIATNVTDLGGGPVTEDAVLDTMQDAWQSGGLQEGETRTTIVNATMKRILTKIFVTDKNYAEATRNVGGVNLQTIETDFGLLNMMLNRYMPVDAIVFASLEDLAPVLLEIPEKGFLFVEPLGKTGSSNASQIYGEVGLEYGNERKHAKIVNSSVDAASS